MPYIRDATLDDAEPILAIYDYYVKNTAISFELVTPSIDAFRDRMCRTLQRYPYLVVEQNHSILGYTYAGPFIRRAAYDWSCETTIYLHHSARKIGLGRLLYEALEAKLYAMGILNLYACIGLPEKNDQFLTSNSADFHAHLGFVKAGVFHNCGYKFGRWYHMIWMEKIIGVHKNDQLPVIGYPESLLKNTSPPS